MHGGPYSLFFYGTPRFSKLRTRGGGGGGVGVVTQNSQLKKAVVTLTALEFKSYFLTLYKLTKNYTCLHAKQLQCDNLNSTKCDTKICLSWNKNMGKG